MRAGLFLLAFAAAGLASAQTWTQYHGNAQRTGFSPTIGPSALNLSWVAEAGGPMVSSPVVGADGTIYVGPVLEDALRPKVTVTAFGPDGGVKWKFSTKFVDLDDPSLSTPAVDGLGNIYFGTPDGHLISLDQFGTERWRYQAQNPVIQSPAIGADGRIYVGMDSKLSCFTALGALQWQVPVGDLPLSGGPAIGGDGTIYLPGFTLGQGSDLFAVNANGTVKWEMPLNEYFAPLAPPTVGFDGTIYTAAQGIHAFTPAGLQKWYSEPAYGINGYGSIAVDPDNSLYYSGYVYAWKLNPADGNVIWEYLHTPNMSNLGHCVNGVLVDGAGNIFMGLGDGKRSAIDYEKQIIVLNNNGAKINGFAFPEINYASSPALIGNGSLYIGCLDSRLYAFNVPPFSTIAPLGLAPETGQVTSGNVQSLAATDGNLLVIKGAVDLGRSDSPASFLIDASSSVANPSMFKLDVNARPNQASANLACELFNWSTGLFEVIGTKAIGSTAGDYGYYANGSLGRFVQAGTGKIKARLAVRNPAMNGMRAWEEIVDRAVWKVIP